MDIKQTDGTDRVVPETDGVKLMKGFTIQLGIKRQIWSKCQRENIPYPM